MLEIQFNKSKMKKNPYFSLVNRIYLNSKHFNVLSMITFALLLQVFSLNALFAQNAEEVTVKGKIVDINGEPLIGVNIVPEKSTSMGTITDMDGNFTIKVLADDVLKVTYIGFKEQSIPVEGRVIVNINMEEGSSDLDEVVVVGYGSVKRANLVGSVSSIKATELEDYPATNLTSLLDGKMPGVSISPAQPTGRPGASTRLKIRGDISFGTANSGSKEVAPLYVVDGFIMDQDAFDVIDPSEIESISVLKDASASVYGARGANGVVLVKTKRGKGGKLRVSYSGSYGVGDATRQTETLSAYDHARMLNATNRDKGDYTALTNSELDALKGLDYNWLDNAWKLSSQEKHSINISGGSDDITYFMAGNYLKETGNFDDLDVVRYSYRMGLDFKIAKGLKGAVTLAIDNKNINIPYLKLGGQDNAGNTMENVFKGLLEAPKWTPYLIDGKYVDTENDNIYALLNTESNKTSQNKGTTVNFSLKYEFPKIEGLVAEASYSRRESNNYSDYYLESYDLYQFSVLDESSLLYGTDVIGKRHVKNSDKIYQSYGYGENYQLNASLTYSKTVGLHDFKFFTTYEQTEDQSLEFSGTAEEQILSGIRTQLAFNNHDLSTTSGNLDQNGRMSGVGRLNYSYANKYLLESTLRIESSTKFSEDERLGYFPAIGFSWVASEEPMVQNNIPQISFLKFRTFAGRTGVDYLGSYEYRLQYNISDSYLFGDGASNGLSVLNSGIVGTGVTWEKNDMYNAGLDVKLWDSKFGVTIDAFYMYSFDILGQNTANLAISAGMDDVPSDNKGRLEAWGYDMVLEYNGKIGNDFSWKVAGVFSFNTNRILEAVSEYDETDWRYEIGKSTYAAGSEEGYIANGIIRTQEQADAINSANREKYGKDYVIIGDVATVGMLYFQDIARPGLDGEPDVVFEPDGKVDANDMTFITSSNDDIVWKNILPTSLSLSANWKNISANAQFNIAWGVSSEIYDKAARQTVSSTENTVGFWSDFWTEENIDADYPDPVWSEYNSLSSTFWVRDVYQLRLRNLSISYKFPQQLIKRWGFSSLRVFFAGENLWTPISTFDYKEDAISRYNTYPYLKKFNFGLNVSL